MDDKSQILIDYSIRMEKAGEAYRYSSQDKKILEALFFDLNSTLSTDIHYLAEMDHYQIFGSGKIVEKYILSFQSESVKSYLMGQMVVDKIPSCCDLIYQMYMHFRDSDEYIAKRGEPSPAHIYVRYDNCFRRLKPKRMKAELFQLAKHPRDAHYLPLTMRMLASWKPQGMRDLLLQYLDGSVITPKSIQLPEDDSSYYPPTTFVRRELQFTAIAGLKYYPSDDVLEILRPYCFSSDVDIRMAATKTVKAIEKMLNKP